MSIGIKFVSKKTMRNNFTKDEFGNTTIEIPYVNLIIGVLIFILGIWAFWFSPPDTIAHGNLIAFIVLIVVGLAQIFIGHVPGG